MEGTLVEKGSANTICDKTVMLPLYRTWITAPRPLSGTGLQIVQPLRMRGGQADLADRDERRRGFSAAMPAIQLENNFSV